jgi:hypothetical protein
MVKYVFVFGASLKIREVFENELNWRRHVYERRQLIG